MRKLLLIISCIFPFIIKPFLSRKGKTPSIQSQIITLANLPELHGWYIVLHPRKAICLFLLRKSLKLSLTMIQQLGL